MLQETHRLLSGERANAPEAAIAVRIYSKIVLPSTITLLGTVLLY